jgi:hypothetical protein
VKQRGLGGFPHERLLNPEGDGAVPLFMRAADGNESDKAVFGQILTQVKSQLQLDSIRVCDSALYQIRLKTQYIGD